MSFVQASDVGAVSNSGNAAASLSGVVAGHGLICYVWTDSATAITGFSDSGSATWSGIPTTTPNLQKDTNNNEWLYIFTATNVAAGTHTITVTGPNAWSILIEDTNANYRTAVGQAPLVAAITACT